MSNSQILNFSINHKNEVLGTQPLIGKMTEEQKELLPLTHSKIEQTTNSNEVTKQLMSASIYDPSILYYEEAIKEMRPLDLLFFSGSELVSGWIRDLSKLTRHEGEWSHCGIIVNKKIIPSLNVSDSDETLYVWESTISSTYDIISAEHTLDAETGKPFFGVQIRKLANVIKGDLTTKSSVVGWAKLIDNPIDKKENETIIEYSRRYAGLQSTMVDLHKKYNHRDYQMNILRLCATMIPQSWPSLKGKLCFGRKWIFCSQLVAIIFKTLGIYPETIKPALVIPEDIDCPKHSWQNLPSVIVPAIVINLRPTSKEDVYTITNNLIPPLLNDISLIPSTLHIEPKNIPSKINTPIVFPVFHE